jgi:hypothetical protein
MLGTALSLVICIILLWMLCRILQILMRTMLGLVSAILFVLLRALSVLGLFVILAVRVSFSKH